MGKVNQGVLQLHMYISSICQSSTEDKLADIICYNFKFLLKFLNLQHLLQPEYNRAYVGDLVKFLHSCGCLMCQPLGEVLTIKQKTPVPAPWGTNLHVYFSFDNNYNVAWCAEISSQCEWHSLIRSEAQSAYLNMAVALQSDTGFLNSVPPTFGAG